MEKAIQQAIDLLPDLRYLIDNCHIIVYGGFIRWIVEWKLKNKEKDISLEDIVEYLENGDVDFRIRSYRQIYDHVTKIQKYVTSHGARMEYVGCGYVGVGCDNETLAKETQIMPLGCKKVYRGTYMIWYPNPLDTSRWIRYELTIFKTSTACYYDDFSVNQLTHNSFKLGDTRKINDIEQKNLDMIIGYACSSNLLKKIWRLRKMWNKGYRPLTSETKSNILRNMEILEEEVKEYREEEDTEILAYILEDENSVKQPSVLNGESTTIYPTKHKYKKITIEDVKNDSLLKEIIDYCSNP